MRRRGVGIAGLQRQQQTNQQFKQAGEEIEIEQLTQMQTQLETFKTQLEEFAKKHRKEIQKNPEFRLQFQKMCTQIGVDPLASNKGFWSELLGVGDFYYELGVQIIDVCFSTRSQNGGLLELTELKRMLEVRRGKQAQAISDDDILRAIKKLKVLGNGFTVLTVGSRQMVQSVPREMNMDTIAVLALAQTSGYVTTSSVVKELGWKSDRVDLLLNNLVKDGIAWIDDQVSERQYWIPSFIKEL